MKNLIYLIVAFGILKFIISCSSSPATNYKESDIEKNKNELLKKQEENKSEIIFDAINNFGKPEQPPK